MTTAAPEPKANMGQPVPRYEARLKVTGEARFGADFPLNNPAYAFLVTSAIAKGRIESIDLAAARAVPGVLEILTQDNTTELKPIKFSAGGGGASTSMQSLGPEIAHDGQIVAMVLAVPTRRRAKPPTRFASAMRLRCRARLSALPAPPRRMRPKSQSGTKRCRRQAMPKRRSLPPQ